MLLKNDKLNCHKYTFPCFRQPRLGNVGFMYVKRVNQGGQKPIAQLYK